MPSIVREKRNRFCLKQEAPRQRQSSIKITGAVLHSYFSTPETLALRGYHFPPQKAEENAFPLTFV